MTPSAVTVSSAPPLSRISAEAVLSIRLIASTSPVLMELESPDGLKLEMSAFTVEVLLESTVNRPTALTVLSCT